MTFAPIFCRNEWKFSGNRNTLFHSVFVNIGCTKILHKVCFNRSWATKSVLNEIGIARQIRLFGAKMISDFSCSFKSAKESQIHVKNVAVTQFQKFWSTFFDKWYRNKDHSVHHALTLKGHVCDDWQHTCHPQSKSNDEDGIWYTCQKYVQSYTEMKCKTVHELAHLHLNNKKSNHGQINLPFGLSAVQDRWKEHFSVRCRMKSLILLDTVQAFRWHLVLPFL